MSRTVGGGWQRTVELAPDEEVLGEVRASWTTWWLPPAIGKLYLTDTRLIWVRARFQAPLGPPTTSILVKDIQRSIVSGWMPPFQTLLLRTPGGARWFLLGAWPWDKAEKVRIKALCDRLQKLRGSHETPA